MKIEKLEIVPDMGGNTDGKIRLSRYTSPKIVALCKQWALEKVPVEITECYKSKRGLCMNCKGRNEVIQEMRERINEITKALR